MDDDISNIQHPSDSLPSTSGNTPAAALEDVEMRFNSARDEESDSLPDLMDVSDSSDSSSESGSIYSAADVQIMMHARDSEEDTATPSTGHESLPGSTPIPSVSPSRLAAPRSNNRRTRVEDDEDSERDRRHPSQRISDPSPDSSQSPSRSSSSSPSQSQSPTRVQTTRIRTTFNIPFTRLGIDQTDPLRFFQHMMPPQQPQQNHTPNARNEPPSAGLAAPPQPPRPSNPNTTPNTVPTPQEQHPQPHGNDNMEQADILPVFAEMLMRLGMLGAVFGGLPGEHEADDPERARKLVDGLETVPIGLVRRLERVGGTDDEDGKRDTMCAICWDQLLEDAGFGKPDSSKESKSDNAGAQESASSPSPSSSRTVSPSPDEAEERKYPKIVTLPCAHVFHADCLIPWFSRPRQTTCPSCRFNIDPENLTRTRRRRSAPRMPAGAPPPDATQPTQNNGQSGQPHTADNNGNATQTGQNGNAGSNRPAGQFIFDQIRFPIVISGRPVFPFNAGPDNGGQDDGGPTREVLDQLRASLEERARARMGQAPSQSSNGSNTDAPPPADGPTIPSGSANNGPPTQPTMSPQSPPQPNLRTGPDDEHTVTHSIVFGFDVVLGGSMMGPPAEGNAMATDDGMGGDGNERDFMGMMMGELFGGRAEPGANENAPDTQQQQGTRSDNMANHGGQANAAGPGAGAGVGGAHQNRGGGGPPPGFPRFFNMNLGNGESLHIASGSGSTMGEAMAQMLNGMGVGMTQPGGNGGPAQNVPNAGATNTNAPPQENTASQNNGRAQTNSQDQNQNQGQQDNAGNGGFFGGMGSMPMQLMGQLLGLSSPTRVRRRNSQGENQPAEATAPPPPSAEAPQPSRAENAAPNTDNAQPPPVPQGNNANANDEGTFTRFMRSMIGSIPAGVMMGGVGPEDANAVPPAGSTQTNTPQSEKKQWALPPAPGPTLRQRIEKREREAGLRCYDVSCGVGPSDEDPLVSVTEEELKQLAPRRVNDDGSTEAGTRMCVHTFHPSCLVSTERVALRGADALVVGDEVEVSCSVCRAVGRVLRTEWEEGMQQLS